MDLARAFEFVLTCSLVYHAPPDPAFLKNKAFDACNTTYVEYWVCQRNLALLQSLRDDRFSVLAECERHEVTQGLPDGSHLVFDGITYVKRNGKWLIEPTTPVAPPADWVPDLPETPGPPVVDPKTGLGLG